jgi:hypothetical protein
MLRGYRFEHPRTEASVAVGGWSYLWAGLFGAFYVWRMGFRQYFLKAFAINLSFLVVFIVAWGITTYAVPLFVQGLILCALVPLLIIFQGALMLKMVREGYYRLGWNTQPG